MREDAETLRRRLYAPGASPDDVARYRDAAPDHPAGPVLVAAPAEEEAASTAPGRVRRLRPLAVAVLVAVLALGAFAAARVVRSAHPDVPAPTLLTMSDADRRDQIDYLAAGDDGGIAAFLLTHPSPPALVHATRFFTVARGGVGTATVDVAPVDAQSFLGRATVLVVLDRPGEVRWTAYRRVVDASGEQAYAPQRARGGEQEAGAISSDTFRYGSGDSPVQLRVEAATGVRWAIAVVLTD